MRRSYEVLTEGLDMIGPVAIEKRLPHVPIPNTTVKRFLADGTALRVRESRSLPDFFFFLVDAVLFQFQSNDIAKLSVSYRLFS